MIVMMNNCVDCAIPCVGGYCPLAECPAVCCDGCGDCAEIFYLLDGEVLCRECFIEKSLDNATTKTSDELLERMD